MLYKSLKFYIKILSRFFINRLGPRGYFFRRTLCIIITIVIVVVVVERQNRRYFKEMKCGKMTVNPADLTRKCRAGELYHSRVFKRYGSVGQCHRYTKKIKHTV